MCRYGLRCVGEVKIPSGRPWYQKSCAALLNESPICTWSPQLFFTARRPVTAQPPTHRRCSFATDLQSLS